jgi:hypothetical protein
MQKMLTPPFNKGLFTGSALSDLNWQSTSYTSMASASFDLRVVDIQTTQDGLLLVSANSIVAKTVTQTPTPGVFAIAHTNSSQTHPSKAIMTWKNEGIQGDFHLVQLISKPCARQMQAVFVDNKQYLVLGTAAALCSPSEFVKHGNQVWLYEIDTNTLEMSSQKKLATGYYNSMGVTVNTDTYDVIFATSGLTSTAIKSYNRIPDDDTSVVETASKLFKITNPFTLSEKEEVQIKEMATLPNERIGDHHISLNHWWRQIKMSPDNTFVLVTMGANCNWNPYCAGGVVAVSVQDGSPYVYSQGQRNALGFMFTTFDGGVTKSVCMTEMNSDMAYGITNDDKTRSIVYQNSPFGKINCMDYRVPNIRLSNWLSNPTYIQVDIRNGTLVDDNLALANYAMDGYLSGDVDEQINLASKYFTNGATLLANTRNTNI